MAEDDRPTRLHQGYVFKSIAGPAQCPICGRIATSANGVVMEACTFPPRQGGCPGLMRTIEQKSPEKK
jgi:hypothetical protein